MKRLAAIAAFIGAVAWAGSDTEPWEAVQTQKEFKKPVQFDREAYFSSIDAGPSQFTSISATTVKADLLDAGAGTINGVLRVGGAIIGAAEIGTTAGIDAGYGMINGQLNVLGPALTGVKSKVGTVTTASARAQDGGVQTPLIQFGYGAGAGGVLAVTYQQAFTSNPQCQCTHVGTTNTNACVLTTGAVPTTTAASFTVTSGGTDVIHWTCMGDQ